MVTILKYVYNLMLVGLTFVIYQITSSLFKAGRSKNQFAPCHHFTPLPPTWSDVRSNSENAVKPGNVPLGLSSSLSCFTEVATRCRHPSFMC